MEDIQGAWHKERRKKSVSASPFSMRDENNDVDTVYGGNTVVRILENVPSVSRVFFRMNTKELGIIVLK